MKKLLSVILLAVLFFTVLQIKGQNIPEPMQPQRLVNDYAAIFEDVKKQEMEDSLVLFDKETSTQIAVVTVNDLDGYPSSDYALAILRKWGVGRKDKNNGIVLLIKPRNEYGSGNVYIAVGTGLEGVLNDAKAGRIIDEFMLDDLRKGDYTSAAVKGTTVLRSVVRGEFTSDYIEEDELEFEDYVSLVILLVVIILIIVAASHSKGGGSHFGGGGIPPIFWGGSSNSRGFSGGSFGGFGGFRGGSGAGGGAGRSF